MVPECERDAEAVARVKPFRWERCNEKRIPSDRHFTDQGPSLMSEILRFLCREFVESGCHLCSAPVFSRYNSKG